MGTRTETDELNAEIAAHVEKMRMQTARMKTKRLGLPRPGALLRVTERFVMLTPVSSVDHRAYTPPVSFGQGTLMVIVHIDTSQCPLLRSLFEPDDVISLFVLVNGQLCKSGPCRVSMLSAYELIG